MNIAPFKATTPNLELITSPESFFDNVKTEFNNYKNNGFFSSSKEPAFFLYTIEVNGKSHSGIVADTDIEDLVSRSKILKHEKTLVSKEQNMMHLILHRQALVKPVLLSFPDQKNITALISRLKKNNPVNHEISFKSNGEIHKFRKITDKKTVKEIAECFAKNLKVTYIADGHHRASTMSLLYGNQRVPGSNKKFNRLLCAFFPFSQLTIESYNRVIDLTDEISPLHFMAKLSNLFHIAPIKSEARPNKRHQLTMLINNEWYSLAWKQKILKAHKDYKSVLDTALFNQHVLNGILNVENVRFDTRIEYISGTKGTKGLKKKVNERPLKVGFCLPSVKPEDIVQTANNGNTLPPKSTWFIPRLRSGFIVKEF